jgi:hypothetical protein
MVVVSLDAKRLDLVEHGEFHPIVAVVQNAAKQIIFNPILHITDYLAVWLPQHRFVSAPSSLSQYVNVTVVSNSK